METISASIEEWKQYNEGKSENDMAPLHFHLTGNSMYPFFRNQRDEVIVMPCQRELKTGDIVLVRSRNYCGNFILHRIIKIKDNRYLTMGDGNLIPDAWFPRERIYGVAVYAYRGKRGMDLEGTGMRVLGRIWMILRPVRRGLLYMIRRIGRLRAAAAHEGLHVRQEENKNG